MALDSNADFLSESAYVLHQDEGSSTVITSIEALNGLIAALDGLSPNIVPKLRVNTIKPKTIADLPRITVSSTDIKETPIGIGGVLMISTLARGKASKSIGYKATMTFLMDILAESDTQVEEISQKVTQFLFDSRVHLRRSGFVSLSINGISEVVSASIRKTGTKYVDIWKKRLVYRGIYEQVFTETVVPPRIIVRKSKVGTHTRKRLDR